MEMSEYQEKMKEESEKLIHNFAILVNNFNFESKSLIEAFNREHRTLQQNMFRTIMDLMCFMASDEYLTDGRNDGSKNMAKKFIAGYAELIKQDEKQRLVRAGYNEEQAEQKADEYRAQVIANPKQYLRVPYV